MCIKLDECSMLLFIEHIVSHLVGFAKVFIFFKN